MGNGRVAAGGCGIFACLAFTHAFLWLVGGDGAWPPPGTPLPPRASAGVAALLLLGSGGCIAAADWLLRRGRVALMCAAISLGILLLLGGLGLDLQAIWSAGLRPQAHTFAAAIYANQFWQVLHGGVLAIMAAYLLARAAAGRLSAERRVSLDVVRLFWLYAVAQALGGLALTHLAPQAGTP